MGMSGFGYACCVFAVIDFIGPHLNFIGYAYDLTGVWWSPIAASAFGWLLIKGAD